MSDDHSIGRALVDLADEHLDDTLRRLDESTRPIWESQLEVGKTLVTLASTALVLSISATQFYAEKVKNPHWGWMVPVAWFLFALTVVLGASRHAVLGRARSMRVFLEASRGGIRDQLWALTPDDRAERFDEILQGALEKANEYPSESFRYFERLTAIMYFAFAFGLVALLCFATRNLPF
jgi:hypothetical protein